MNLKFVRKGIVIITLIGAVCIPVQQSIAAEDGDIFGLVKQEKANKIEDRCLIHAVAEIQKQEQSEKIIRIESSQELQFNDKVSGKVFVNVEGEYLQILATPEETGEAAGKIYGDSVVKILEKTDEWTKIVSGNVEGYVKTDALIIGRDAVTRAKEILAMKYPEVDILTLTGEEIDEALSVAETAEEELARLEAEEAARAAQEQARIEAEKAASLQKGQEIVDYAKQFMGNPYVYGGTSLTRGTDCSGFVKSVYAHFGVRLPRTSYSMRRVGYSVKYSEIQPGDIICYSGHVGIYAGNGKIVNAIDESKGIGLSNARYRSIITIRRIF